MQTTTACCFCVRRQRIKNATDSLFTDTIIIFGTRDINPLIWSTGGKRNTIIDCTAIRFAALPWSWIPWRDCRNQWCVVSKQEGPFSRCITHTNPTIRSNNVLTQFSNCHIHLVREGTCQRRDSANWSCRTRGTRNTNTDRRQRRKQRSLLLKGWWTLLLFMSFLWILSSGKGRAVRDCSKMLEWKKSKRWKF